MNLNFAKKYIAKTAEKAIKKKTGCKVNIHVDKVNLKMGKGGPNVQVSLDIKPDKINLTKFLEMIV